ncbi:MAG: ECF transporter S component [Verrucomicrobiota bacterium]
MNPSAASFICILSLMVMAAISLERSKLSYQKLALIASLAAVIAVSRIPLALIPNVQLVTALIICSGIAYGRMIGLAIGMLVPLISNLFLGHGPWTIWQMFAWGLCGFISGVPMINRMKQNRWSLAFYGAGWGFLYGWITNLWFWLTAVSPLTIETWVSYCLVSSSIVDFIHAVNNFIFLALLGLPVLKIFSQYRHYDSDH